MHDRAAAALAIAREIVNRDRARQAAARKNAKRRLEIRREPRLDRALDLDARRGRNAPLVGVGRELQAQCERKAFRFSCALTYVVVAQAIDMHATTPAHFRIVRGRDVTGAILLVDKHGALDR
jgi:hypothetical protein